MLPSTGLFKSINCPFFASDSCSRPFCHFKHSRKDEAETEAPPVYTPTQKTETVVAKEKGPVAKKAKLEYVPHSISTKAVTNDHPAPSYIPNLSVLKTNPDDISFEEIDEELNLISDILQDVESNGDAVEAPVATYKPSKIVNDDAPEVKVTEKENIEKKEEKPPESAKEKEMKPKEEKKHKSSRSSDRSHSSKSRHHSSSKSSHRSHRSSSKSRDSDKKSSSSSRRHHSSRSSSKSSSDKKSGKSSSSHKSKGSSSSSRKSDSQKQKILADQDVDIFALEAESSDEDDIMEQCKLIFEEFQEKQPQEPAHQEEKKPIPEVQEPYEDVSKKKRVAHENAQKRPSLLPAPPKRTNHMQNALQSVYQRQKLVRRQLEAAKEVKEPQKPEPQLKSPPQSPGQNPTPRRMIAPVSNTVALMNAKKRIEELRRQKTIAQTASKVGKRIAHANPAILTEQPAPPVLEPTATKISYNLRMQYYNIMVKHCQGIYPNFEDAWQRAQTEELTVFKKCSSPVIYKSSASLVVNKLRKESIEAGNHHTDRNNLVSHDVILAGKSARNTSWSINKKTRTDSTYSGNTFDTIASSKAYDLAADCVLTEDQLRENGFPRPGKHKGQATICKTYQNHHLKPPNPDERYCSRCSKLFTITCYDRPGVDECNYHPKSTGFRRGCADNHHRCCQQVAGTPGCMYANYHVSHQVDYENLTGFVTTISRDEEYVCTRNDIFALDCEMCYTTEGLELTRVTVVDVNQKVVYDALVKPDNRIVDYNTTYSGITEAMLAKETRTLREVQAVLLSMFHSRTILVGHSLESDLQALKMIHSHVVDTSVLYPHKMGPPKKRALKTLCIENLKRIIQENESGHDSAEDAEVCIQLLKEYLRNRIT
ncbi:RNA exonuclease 1 homolog isoform X2 [Phlebotomus papatasi]|uniref:RNA exonuclease 1 homolog isoform X2 n=1 Tax=Phlebotomus papatasi TaxID=29031 RepID=UPI0024836CF2|nr:RNA exonuclease 1 homolog isoform X2 [Phlebotomus papatasi]